MRFCILFFVVLILKLFLPQPTRDLKMSSVWGGLYSTPPQEVDRIETAGYCTYCQEIGQDPVDYKTHCLRNPITQEVICPNLPKDL